MKKVLLFLVFFLTIPEKSISDTKKSFGCNNEISENSISSIDKLKIKSIEVDINNYRDWTVNGIKILINKSRYTSNKFKQRYDSTITVNYEDEIKCVYPGRVRHSGDEKDHISLLGNTIIQSIDVHLKSGNIRGITRFKLLRPKTRGNLEDEIIITEILRNLNYLAPRTIKVNARLNDAYSEMIFQEKASKEMLEYNNRREAPILEGDERFFWKRIEKLPDNQLSNWSIGVVPLLDKSAKHLVVKQVNSSIINKSEGYKKMSIESLSKLNLIHFYFSNQFQNDNNNFHYFDYDLDNTLLGLLDDENILKLDIYNLFAFASNGNHGLAPNNRKFYWNSIENYFEPINYDSNSNIYDFSLNQEKMISRLPISDNFQKAFVTLEEKLNNLNLVEINKNILNSGIEIDSNTLEKKINIILSNINFIEKSYLNLNEDTIKQNKFKPIKNILNIFNKNIEDIDPDLLLVKYDKINNKFQRCKLYLKYCDEYNFSNINLSKLLEGELELEGKKHQFLGNDIKIINIAKEENYKFIKYKDSEIFYEDGAEVEILNQGKNININQNVSGSKVYIINGSLINTNIIFNGYKIKTNSGTNENTKPKDYPSGSNGLTGCLSFINMDIKNISLNSKNSSCEDAVNFINVEGTIKSINIENSFSDAFDADFSKINIGEINIKNAINDCTDFSAGVYKIDLLYLENCGDKGLSAGEKSLLSLKQIFVRNSKIGVASKDSSSVKLNDANFINTKTCVAAYNKKQEFNGGFIEINKMNCENYKKKISIDSVSKVQENKLL